MSQDQQNALPAGYEIEGYRIERILGAGGFGITYLAREKSLDRPVAIKEYLPHGIAVRDPDGATIRPLSSRDADDFEWGLLRFRQEAETLVTFRHPNIVPVLRFFEANGTAYLVMEYQQGRTLAGLLESGGPPDEAQVLSIVMPMLDGLEEIHQARFLHRDIKPENISLRGGEIPVLLDFGSARQALGRKSRSLTTILTAGYAPFEQYHSGGDQGPWTDIYGFAATLYFLVTGKPPTEAPGRIMNDPLVPAVEACRGRYSPALLAAIDAGLAVQAEDRPRDIATWRAMFEGRADLTLRVAAAAPAGATLRVAAEAPVGATLHAAPALAPAPAGAQARPSRRLAMPVAVAIAAVAIVGLAAGAAAIFWPDDGPAMRVAESGGAETTGPDGAMEDGADMDNAEVAAADAAAQEAAAEAAAAAEEAAAEEAAAEEAAAEEAAAEAAAAEEAAAVEAAAEAAAAEESAAVEAAAAEAPAEVAARPPPEPEPPAAPPVAGALDGSSLQALLPGAQVFNDYRHSGSLERRERWNFHSDGTLSGNYEDIRMVNEMSEVVDNSGSDTGTWTVRGGQLCVTWKSWYESAERCHAVRREGDSGRYYALDRGGRRVWELLP